MSELSRRTAIKIIGAAAGAVGITLPVSWESATVEAATLPAAPPASCGPNPTAPLVGITNPSPTGSPTISNSLTPIVTGTSTPGSTVTVVVDGRAPANAVIDTPAGDWGYLVSPALSNAGGTVHTITATATRCGLSSTTATVTFWVQIAV